MKTNEEHNLNCDCKREAKEKEQALHAAFCLAAAANDTVMLEQLEKAGALEDVRRNIDALECAADKAHLETLRFLLPKFDGDLWADEINKVLLAAAQSKNPQNLQAVQLILDWVDGKLRPPRPPQPSQPQGPAA